MKRVSVAGRNNYIEGVTIAAQLAVDGTNVDQGLTSVFFAPGQINFLVLFPNFGGC